MNHGPSGQIPPATPPRAAQTRPILAPTVPGAVESDLEKCPVED
jgi:hypothetical protein